LSLEPPYRIARRRMHAPCQQRTCVRAPANAQFLCLNLLLPQVPPL
jgi:hypothetical protein